MKKIYVYRVLGYLNGDFVDYGCHSSLKKAYCLVSSAFITGTFKQFSREKDGIFCFCGTLSCGDDLVLSIQKFSVF